MAAKRYRDRLGSLPVRARRASDIMNHFISRTQLPQEILIANYKSSNMSEQYFNDTALAVVWCVREDA